MIPVITGCIGIVISITLILMLRHDKLHAHHTLFWACIAVASALLGFAPGIVDWVAHQLGIGYPPVLAFALAIGLIMVKLLLLDLEHSRLLQRNERLVQHCAMQELELRKLEARMQAVEGASTESAGE